MEQPCFCGCDSHKAQMVLFFILVTHWNGLAFWRHAVCDLTKSNIPDRSLWPLRTEAHHLSLHQIISDPHEHQNIHIRMESSYDNTPIGTFCLNRRYTALITSQKQQEDGYESLRHKSEARRGTCRASFRKDGLECLPFRIFRRNLNVCPIWLLLGCER